MGELFAGRSPRDPGLAVFLTAGAEPAPLMASLVGALDDAGADCLELAVPFPNSPTDGPVLRRAADRALARGTGLAEVLGFLDHVRPASPVVVLADWRHTVAPLGEREFARRVAGAGAAGALVHALPPRRRAAWLDAAGATGLPVVTTCYPGSSAPVRAAAARDATAYLYLVAHYGRTGTAPADGHATLARAVARLRVQTRAPIAVGFGVRSRADVSRVAAAGADAAIVGTAATAAIDAATAAGHDPAAAFLQFVRSLRTGDRAREEGVKR